MVAVQKKVTFEVVQGGCHKCTSHWNGSYTSRPRQQKGRKSKFIVRLLWETKFGRVLERKEVLRHSCDNPWCINVEHVSVGTQADNIRDAVNKGRMAKGSKAGQSILNDEQVIKIRSLYASGFHTQKEIARMFEVSRECIVRITTRKNWKHL